MAFETKPVCKFENGHIGDWLAIIFGTMVVQAIIIISLHTSPIQAWLVIIIDRLASVSHSSSNKGSCNQPKSQIARIIIAIMMIMIIIMSMPAVIIPTCGCRSYNTKQHKTRQNWYPDVPRPQLDIFYHTHHFLHILLVEKWYTNSFNNIWTREYKV